MNVSNPKRNLILVAVFSAAAIGFYVAKVPVWFLFLMFAIYNAWRVLRPASSIPSPATISENVKCGVLGLYAVDGDERDLSFGLYIRLQNRPVFVSIKEDQHLEERKKIATEMFNQSIALGENLSMFISENSSFAGRTISAIGLHSDELNRGEVFWNPEGYTLMRDFKFLNPETK